MGKKIAEIQIVTKYFHPVMAGIETHIFEVAKRLVRWGWKVTVYTSKDTLEKRNVLNDEDYIEGIEVKRFKSLHKLAKSIDYNELIYLNNFDFFLTFFIFLRILGKNVKIILAPHGGFTPWWDGFSLLPRLIKRLYHKTLGKFFINHLVKKVVAVSEWEKSQLVSEGIKEDLIAIIPNGIEDEAFKRYDGNIMNVSPKIPANIDYIVTVCRVTKRKNVNTIIKTLSYFENLYLVICGPIQDKEYYQYLQNLAVNLDIKHRVHFVGYVDKIEKYWYMDNSKAFILISLHETDPIAVKEAKARGKPVIVSNKASLPFLVKDGINGFVVNIDEGSVTQAIKKVLGLRKKELERIKESNLEDAKEYRWDIAARRIESLFNLCLKVIEGVNRIWRKK